MRRGRPHGRGTRLSTQVAVAYALGTTAVLSATGWALDRALAVQLASRDAEELIGKLDQLRHLVAEQSSVDALAQARHAFSDLMIGHRETALRIDDANGTPVLQLETAVPAVEAASALAPDQAALPEHVRLLAAGSPAPWQVLVADAPLRGAAASVRITLARSTAESAQIRTRFRRVLAPIVLLAAVANALYGWMVVTRGVAPLRRVAAAAQRLGERHLDERLPIDHGSAEIRTVAVAFNAMAARLGDGMTRLAQYGDELAHELRTPLATLIAHTEVVLGRARSSGELRALHESNLEEYARLSRMVDEMLFLAQAENARIALRRVPLELRAVVERIAELYEPLAEERSVRLDVSGAARANADPALIERAVSNLLANAIRHARSGSTVALRLVASPTQSEIVVRNAGDGIAPPDLAHVFERFWRADRARADATASSGLGLSIVRSIARLHDGQVTAASELGQWAEFRIVLPAAAQFGDVIQTS